LTASPHRLRRALARAAKWTAIAIASLVVALLAVLDTAPVRRLVVVEANRALAPMFQGAVHIDALGGLSLFGIGGADVTVFDAAGTPVLTARSVRVRVATWSVLRSVLSSKGPLTIAVSEVSIDRVDARLDKDAAGQIGLAGAFSPKQPPSPTTNEKPGRGLRLVFGRIALAHVSAQGNAVGPPLDVHVDDFAGAFTYAPEAIDADVSNAAVRAHKLAGAVDLAGTLLAHVHAPSAAGAVPDGSVTWHGTVATTTSTLTASLRGGTVDGVLEAPAVSAEDVRAFWAASPFDTPGRLHVEAHGPLSRVTIALRAGIGDAAVTADGTVDAEHAGPAHAVVNAEVPQGSARVDVDVAREGHAQVLRLGIAAHVERIDRIPKLPPGMNGSLDLVARGALPLDTMVVDADAEVIVARFVAGANQLASVSLDARVRGPVGEPDVAAVVHARSMVLAGRRVDFADVGVRGSLHDLSVKVQAEGPDIPRVDLSAAVQVGRGVAIHQARLALGRAADHVVLSVPTATVEDGAIRVDGARIEGAGGPVGASFEADAGHLRVRATSEGLDLGVLARVGGLQSTVASGVLAFDIDADVRRDRATGRAAVRLDRGAFGATRGVSGAVEVALDGRQVRGRLRAEAADVGSIDVDAPKLVLAGEGPLSALSWRRARGDVTLEGRADLAKLAELVPVERSPLAQAAGHVTVAGHLARADAGDSTPDVRLAITTQGLHLVPKVDAVRDIDGVWVVPDPPWHLDGIDFAVDARIEGATGRVEVGVTARDTQGPFVQLDAACPRFPSADMLRDPPRVARDLRTTAFDVHVTVPRRDLGGLPAMLRQDFVSGAIEADVRASGTMLAPRVDATVTVHDSVVGSAARPMPLELDLSAHYDGRHANVSLKANVENREVLASEAQADLDAASLVAGTAGALPWTASARAHFDALPLKAIAALDDKTVSGRVSGDVTLDGFHRDAGAEADLSIDGLRVGTVAYESGTVTLRAREGHLGGEVRINQSDGFVDAKVDADAAWGAAMAPVLATDRPLKADVASKNFRIAALLPFVDSLLDRLDGRLDSDAHLELDPKTRQAHLAGTLSLAKGTLEASAGGGEFHDISAQVSLAPDGSFAITKLSASGMTGHLDLTGSGQMDGLRLRSAKATVTIPKNAAIPVTAGGAELGSIDGRIELSAAQGQGALRLQVAVPSIRVTLPEASSADVASLGAMTDVRIGAHRGNPATFVLLPEHPAQAPAKEQASEGLAVAVQIGDAEVVRGTDLRVHLDGQVAVQGASVSGRIVLKRGGVLTVQGKTFTVEDGTVTFAGTDPSNPQVVVRAGYTAPDGTIVYAAFVGPLKTGKVTLSSEPSYPRQEIVELLLFGTTGGPQAQSPQPDATGTVVGSVGGEAAQPLNHALDQMGLGSVRADVDTTSSANPRPEVEIQIARDISLKVAVVVGQVPPGVNPDHTLLTVGWRFLSRWSLASTLGDAGTTVFDLLWQRRY